MVNEQIEMHGASKWLWNTWTKYGTTNPKKNTMNWQMKYFLVLW